jgi:hypothetical protein
VKGVLPSVNADWLGTAYSGGGWLKLRNCFAFMVRSSSCNFVGLGVRLDRTEPIGSSVFSQNSVI